MPEAEPEAGDPTPEAAVEVMADVPITDEKLAMEVLQSCGGHALRYAADSIRGNRAVVSSAVRSYGDALRYASSDLRASKELVLIAVQSNGLALEHVSNEALKADREVALMAVNRVRRH